jgi:ribose/xylose/arabinose/galactoside ABC-type transport system permease subunit
VSVVSRPAGRGALEQAALGAALGRYGVWVALAVTLAYGVVAVPRFATVANLDSVLRQASTLGIVSIGQTFVVLTAGIDLSVGMLMGLVTVLGNGIMNGDPGLILPVVGLALGIGLVVGLANGAGVVIARVQPLIVTLAMLSVLQGLIFLYTDRTVGEAPDAFRELAYGTVAGVPAPFLLFLALAVAGWALLRVTPLGRQIVATGSDEGNARRAGIAVGRVKGAAYVLSGLLAAVAGLVLAARLGSGYTLAGAGFELDSVVAVVLGGTALSGGRGGVMGTLAGVLLLTLIANILNLSGVTPFAQQVVNGIVIIVAIALYTARQRAS